jgi:decaprenylphospho-beta-D-erythro-pentofuranosid-2-ulose 2-reductase
MKDASGAVQSVLVLGGGSDIGQAIVRALVAERARTVVLAARRPAELEPFAAEARAAGATTVEPVAFDADDAGTHRGFVDATFDRFGDFDLVVVAFGVLGDQERDERDAAAAVAVMQTNLVGPVSLMTEVARRLESQGHGTLAVLSSVAAERPRRSNYVYGASKAGLDAYAQGLSDRLAGTGARVLVVRPGFVHTKMTAGLDSAPLSTTPERVAATLVEGVRRGAHTVWAPPALRYVFMVLRHLPRPLFRRLDL